MKSQGSRGEIAEAVKSAQWTLSRLFFGQRRLRQVVFGVVAPSALVVRKEMVGGLHVLVSERRGRV